MFNIFKGKTELESVLEGLGIPDLLRENLLYSASLCLRLPARYSCFDFAAIATNTNRDEIKTRIANSDQSTNCKTGDLWGYRMWHEEEKIYKPLHTGIVVGVERGLPVVCSKLGTKKIINVLPSNQLIDMYQNN